MKIRKLQREEVERVYNDRISIYLRNIGWTKSAVLGRAVDASGQPIPWFTYASLSFLIPRIKKDFTVFEYGSGYSTVWWAERTKWVVACEHHAAWYDLIKPKVPANVTYVFRQLDEDGDYAKEITRHADRRFDLVIIDGRDRVNCMKYALGCVSPTGVIIWDNSERTRYKPGLRLARNAGFRRIDFTGLAPVGHKESRTSIFYRSENCLGI